jgi:hypothetical protein
MPPDQHVNPAEEPSSTPSPSRPEAPATGGTRFMPGALRDPASRVRIASQVMRIGRPPDNDIIVTDRGVSKHHAELRLSPAGRYSIIDLGSHNGTYVNGTRVSQQELNEGDIIAIGHATFRLAGGELIEYAGGGADGELLAAMIVIRLERWLELEGAFEVPGVGQVELAGDIGWEPERDAVPAAARRRQGLARRRPGDRPPRHARGDKDGAAARAGPLGRAPQAAGRTRAPHRLAAGRAPRPGRREPGGAPGAGPARNQARARGMR